MKKVLFSIFLSLLFFLLLTAIPKSVSAQACTGDSGGSGQCAASMACPPARIDGQGNCVDPNQICCLDSAPTGGTADCGDSCTSDSQCISGLTCTNRVCSGSICPFCTGTSGYSGTCLGPSICQGQGRTVEQVCTSTPGTNCCTNAPPTQNCTLTANPPFIVGAVFFLDLETTTPNTFYTFQTAPSCNSGSCLGGVTTDSNGNATCSVDCGPPASNYTITANAGSTYCNAFITVQNIPGPPCTGAASGLSGYCAVGIACPQGYPDTDGSYPNQCSTPGAICCVPSATAVPSSNIPIYCDGSGNPTTDGSSEKLYTAIGCIPIGDVDQFLGYILPWALGIAGGIAFLLIVYAGFQIITSAGDPQKLQAGKELLTSAVMGLLLILFAAFILQFIGITILNIPGF